MFRALICFNCLTLQPKNDKRKKIVQKDKLSTSSSTTRFRRRDFKALGYKLAVVAAVALILVLIGVTFFGTLSRRDDVQRVFIDDDDTTDSVFAKVEAAAGARANGFRILSRYSNYAEHIRTGAYVLRPRQTTFMFFWHVRRGEQTPVKVVVPTARTLERFSALLSTRLMADSATIIGKLRDEAVCKSYGYDTATIACMLIPNTYEMYWNISAERFLDRMKTETELFWNATRRHKAQALGLTPVEVVTIASIVNQETANNEEKPAIAGLYYNRLQADMPLQADPTVKYAAKNFAAKRIYKRDTETDSPYNTYKYRGLPPGPICIPDIADIDAVLDMQHHDYLYMCAEEDFSGRHNFASTYEEHRRNARRYANALNRRGIK